MWVIMNIELLVLDCDGVILESMDVKGQAFGMLGLEYGQEMADRMMLYHAMHGGVSRFEKFDWLYQEVFKRPITPEEAKSLNEKFINYAKEKLQTCPLVPGVLDVLERWNKKIPIYVASAAPQDELSSIMQLRGIAHYFTKICGYPPAKTQVLRSIIYETGANPQNTLMVGDSQSDLQAAEAVGCLFYGRGKLFIGGHYPWHEDLSLLNTYLEELDLKS